MTLNPRAWVAGVWALAVAHAALAWWLNAPGHLSLDSMVHLIEANKGRAESFHPLFVTWWAAVTNRIMPEGAGFALTTTLAHALAIGLCAHAFRAGWAALVAIALWAFWPTLLMYDGIVWKDVLVANWAVLASVLQVMLHGANSQRAKWALSVPIGLLAVGIALARQNGLAFVLPIVMAWAWVCGMQAPSKVGWLARTSGAFGAVLLAMALTQGVLSRAYHAPDRVQMEGPVGLIVLASWDVAGIIRYAPEASYRTAGIPEPAATELAQAVRASYHPSRVDSLSFGAAGEKTAVHLSSYRHWWTFVTQHPAAYIEHRARGYWYALGFQDQVTCLPYHLGVSVLPPHLAAQIQLSRPSGPHQPNAFQRWYWGAMVGTPTHNHTVFLAVLAFAALWALRRGPRQHAVLLGSSLGALGFGLSFALVGLACDFRYMYLVLPVAFWALVYLAAQFSPPRPLRATSDNAAPAERPI